jgi:hypothetical protein
MNNVRVRGINKMNIFCRRGFMKNIFILIFSTTYLIHCGGGKKDISVDGTGEVSEIIDGSVELSADLNENAEACSPVKTCTGAEIPFEEICTCKASDCFLSKAKNTIYICDEKNKCWNIKFAQLLCPAGCTCEHAVDENCNPETISTCPDVIQDSEETVSHDSEGKDSVNPEALTDNQISDSSGFDFPMPDGFSEIPGFGCSSQNDCQKGMICCDFGGSGFKMCMPADMCFSETKECSDNSACTAEGQICCMTVGDPPYYCLPEKLCPKECADNNGCPPNQECCLIPGKKKICVDKGQCPKICVYDSDCMIGEVCCDAAKDYTICVSDQKCKPPSDCSQVSECDKDQECCTVPGFSAGKCVYTGGCEPYHACETDATCSSGKECCEIEGQGKICIPFNLCKQIPGKECTINEDCTPDICCIVPSGGKMCSSKEKCPSQCLSDEECGNGNQCCVMPDNPAICMPFGQCITGKKCSEDKDCSDLGQICCEMQGSKTCMPPQMCVDIGGPCESDENCKSGLKCCNFFGKKMCLQKEMCIF